MGDLPTLGDREGLATSEQAQERGEIEKARVFHCEEYLHCEAKSKSFAYRVADAESYSRARHFFLRKKSPDELAPRKVPGPAPRSFASRGRASLAALGIIVLVDL